MKYWFAFILTLLVTAETFGQNSCRSTMQFERYYHDFKEIREIDGVTSCHFEFTNTGDKPFVIERVEVSCGCTTPKFSKAPIMPGAKGSIEVAYDPTDRPGSFNKGIKVVSNGGKNINELFIKGSVVAKPKGMEELYPYELGASGVRISNKNINMGYVEQGEVKSSVVACYNNTNRSVKVEVVPELPGAKSGQTYTIEPHKSIDITLTCDLRHKEVYGMIGSRVNFKVDGDLVNTLLMVNYIGIDKRLELSMVPQIIISKSYFNIKARRGEAIEEHLYISNSGTGELKISSCKGSDGLMSSLKAGDVIAPGGRKRVTLTLTIVDDYGMSELYSSLHITSNDPNRPIRKIGVSVNVKE